MFVWLLPYLVVILVNETQGLCGDTVRWSHHVNIDDVYGMWYGVGYAQHNPDMTNKPNEIGCVSLYITDATNDVQDNWLDWSFQQRNFSGEKWRSSKSNPWSENAMAGSWLDVRLKRRARRDTADEKRIRVLWDEDGHTLEQTYLYYPEEPGLWTAEVLRPGERQLISRGIDVWYPDDPPRHPDVIRLLKATEHTLVLNHCAELGEKWRSSKSNPWSENAMAGSWLDVRLKRRARRDTADEKRIRVLWDEDGHTLEQTYLYYPEEPGLWTAEVLRPGERQLISRGIDVWYPDDPPRHPDVIRLLKATEHTLVLNHCAELGNGGIFTLILRRSPSRVHKYEWYQYQKEFYKFELPNVYRYSAVCAAWAGLSSSLFLIISIILLRLFS